jgi:hypothetical protein
MKGPGAVLFDVNGNPVTIMPDGSVAVTILDGYVTLSGTSVFAVSNFPATQVVSGSVTVSNLPVTQPVSGTVAVSNFPATQPVTGTFWQATQPVSGSITLLGTSAVSGTVSVSNFPATQPVSIVDGYVTLIGPNSVSVSNFPVTQPVSGSVSVSNFPASQTVSVSNFPATQVVSGTVSVSDFPAFPAIQAVSQSGAWSIVTNKSSTSSVTQVTPSTSVTTVLAVNAARTSAHLSNGSAKQMYVKLGAAASTTSYTDIILAGDAYDVPDDYTGVITAVWANGVATTPTLQITELSP